MNWKYYIALLLFFTFHYSSFSQKYFNNWYFGDSAAISFDTSPPSELNNSVIFAYEGNATVSDSLGNLLFYTDGITVWNKFHDTMLNGFGLFGGASSTQAAQIVKKPGYNQIYYIFTTDDITGNVSSNKGINYSIVDMNLDGQNGAVTIKNVKLVDNSAEKISTTLHKNRKDVWITVVRRGTDQLYTYLLSESGLSLPKIYRNIGNIVGGNAWNQYGSGQMKFSINGKHLAYVDMNANSNHYIHILDFDNSNGNLSNPRKIYNFQIRPYGIEFSPSGKLLYSSFTSSNGSHFVYQFQMDSLTKSADFSLMSNNLFRDSIKAGLGIQLGPDRKIYLSQFFNPIACINAPDSIGIKCDINHNAITLKYGRGLSGLPSYVQSSSYFNIESPDTVCIDDSFNFQLAYSDIDSIKWDLGDGTNISLSNTKITCKYNNPGTYNVSARLFLKDGYIPIANKKIHIISQPKSNISLDTTICFGDSLYIDLSNSNIIQYYWSDGSSNSTKTISEKGLYTVKYTNGFCHSMDSFNIKIGNKPLLYLGNDTAFCHTFSHILDAGKNYKSYLWNTGDDTYKIQVNSEGIYSVEILDSLTCEASDTIELEELKKPEIISILDTITCEYVKLLVNYPNKNVSYQWSNGDNGTTITTKTKGIFTLNVYNRFCSISDTVNVNMLPKPNVDLGKDTMLCGSMMLSSNEIGHYMWNTGQTSPSILTAKPGIYWLKISRNNCESYDSITLLPCKSVSYFIPNAFSPNNDNTNDQFKVYGTNIESIHLVILNSWGEVLFDTTEPNPYWNGTYKNDECQQGVYFYVIEINGYNKKKFYENGTFHLLR